LLWLNQLSACGGFAPIAGGKHVFSLDNHTCLPRAWRLH